MTTQDNPSLEIKDFKAEGVVEILYSHIVTLELRVKSLEDRCEIYEDALKKVIKSIQENTGLVCEHVKLDIGNQNGI